MVFQQIELINIKQFANRKFLFQTGWNEITLGNLGGKSTVIEAVQAAFSSVSPAAPFFKMHTEETAVHLDILLKGIIFSVQKRWDRQKPAAWSAVSHERQYDLLNADERLQWMKFFVQVNFKTGSEADLPAELIERRYHFLVQCLYQPAVEWLDRLMERDFRDCLFSAEPYEHVADKLSQLEQTASTDLQRLKLTEQKLILDRKAFDHRRRETEKLDHEIKRTELLMRQLQEHHEQVQAEQAQTESLHEYIAEKKSEIERIEIELTAYQKIRDAQARLHYSDDEIAELNAKRKGYEDLTQRVTDLEQKVIERSHLSKNLAGIQNEIQKLQASRELAAVDPGGGKDIDSTGQIGLYESEIRRIRALLDGDSDLEERLENLHREKLSYQTANERYLTVTRTEHLLTQEDSKTVENRIEKLLEQLAQGEKNLEELQASVHENRYRDRMNMLQQVSQQILELRKKSEELIQRRSALTRVGETHSSGHEDVEKQIRQRITLKRYLALMREAMRHLKQTAAEKMNGDFLESLNSHAASTPWPNEFIRLISIVNDPDAKSREHSLKRFSHTELRRFSLWLHLSMIRIFTSLDCVILDEHLAWMFDHEELNRIYTMADRMSLEQLIFFQRMPFS